MFVMTTAEVKSHILRIANQWFALTYVQLFVAVLVAMIGIVNSLTVSIVDRRRELGVLRALGGYRHQIRRAIWMEGAAIGLSGAILSLGMGAVLLWFNIAFSRMDAFGYRFEYLFPIAFALLLLPLTLTASFVASLAPAESAARGSLVEALEYE
jgi:putative ABC transport system permease protein